MEKKFSGLLGLGLLCFTMLCLGIAGVYFWDKLGRKEAVMDINEGKGVKNEVIGKIENLGESTLLLKFFISSGVDGGGRVLSGIIAEVVDGEEEIKTKQGEVLGKGKLFLKVAYLDPEQKWRAIKVPVVMEDGEGKVFEAFEDAKEVSDLSELKDRYLGWVGREVNITVFLDDIEARYAWLYKLAEERGDTTYTIRNSTDVLWRTNLVAAYESSWRVEISDLKSTGKPGQMAFVIPVSINLNKANKQVIPLPSGL